ncbi:PPOX class F420-dependent oxidoreductase [Microbacterium sp.]|uniref:PPOX class F420-dependent oxidoreductase n=1 Tax=Microbacterium sp. TaxID=51671 RepID=UPI003A84F54F
MTELAQSRYVSLTSYRKDGTPVSLPVWIADLGDGTAGFTTGSGSYKVKRIRRNPAVTLRPCDARGNVTPGSPVVEATARVVSDGGYTRVRRAIVAKYGIQARLLALAGVVRGWFGRSTSDVAIEVTFTA